MKMNLPTNRPLVAQISNLRDRGLSIRWSWATRLLPLLLLALPATMHGPVPVHDHNGTVTITEYTDPGGAMTIPDTINGLPVTTVGDGAFYEATA